MELQEALVSRRTVFRFKPEPVPRDVLEKVFSYGIWAPNHHTTEPWRFVVLGKETKETGILENKAKPIYEFAAEGDVNKLSKALKHCKDIDATNAEGNTALMETVTQKDYLSTCLLLHEGASALRQNTH